MGNGQLKDFETYTFPLVRAMVWSQIQSAALNRRFKYDGRIEIHLYKKTRAVSQNGQEETSTEDSDTDTTCSGFSRSLRHAP